MHQDATWYGGRPQPRGLCVRWGPSPFPKRRRSPQFLAHVYCGQTAGWIKIALGMEVGLGPVHIMLDGDTAPPKRGRAPQFLSHLYCGQTAGCIQMPLGMEIGLSPGDFVVRWGPSPYPKRGGAPPNFRPTCVVAKQLHGSRCHLLRSYTSAYATLCSMWTQLPPEKGHNHPHPIFGPCLLWPNGWMDEDASWYGSRPRPRPHCSRRSPSSRERGIAAPRLFGPCLLWPRSPISATAELLL